MLRIVTIIIFGFLVIVSGAVKADSWAMPEVQTFSSTSGEYSFVVEPLVLANQLAYFQDSAFDDNSEYPKGRLVSKTGQVLWARKLVNWVSPFNAMVSPSGRYVVTFDDWHSVGYGSVVVIYGRQGELIQELSLRDIVGVEWASLLPKSISSIWWSGQHQFESDDVLLLSVVAKKSRDPKAQSNQQKYETIRVRLEDGRVLDQ